MIRSLCDSSRTRFALFRMLAKLGIGCGSLEPAEVVVLTDRPRHNPLEDWTVGISYYLIISSVFGDTAFRLFDGSHTIFVVTVLVFFPLSLFVTVASVGLGSLLLDRVSTDVRKRPELQSRVQQIIIVVVSIGLVGFAISPARWIGAAYLWAIGLNAAVALIEMTFTGRKASRSETSS